jgi:hypothetical protein
MSFSLVELKLIENLLSLASNEFANHGCNDFYLKDVITSKNDRRELKRRMHEWNGDLEEAEEYGWLDSDLELDYFLMGYLAARVKEEI